MYDISCVGHITLDKVITPKFVKRMAGGTSFYFSNALQNLDLKYILITSLAATEMDFVESLRSKQIEVRAFPSRQTVYFENRYSEDQNNRSQRVLQVSDPFTESQIFEKKAAIIHLGPLLAGDIPVTVFKSLSSHSKISLDVQGYLRKVENTQVYPIDWKEKRKALRHVHFLKANESEMEVLTGSSDVQKASRILYKWGVREIIITLGSRGSVIFDGSSYYNIPAFKPYSEIVDATGCGDTYMAGYLYKRSKGYGYYESGEFAAAMATLKIESSGPFTGTIHDIENLLQNTRERILPGIEIPSRA